MGIRRSIWRYSCNLHIRILPKTDMAAWKEFQKERLVFQASIFGGLYSIKLRFLNFKPDFFFELQQERNWSNTYAPSPQISTNSLKMCKLTSLHQSKYVCCWIFVRNILLNIRPQVVWSRIVLLKCEGTYPSAPFDPSESLFWAGF